ncbi:hypothetical protein ACFVAV_17930 [Nocardia sp. NPDC057663]|uniref:hypothetical protein n=1 Tax=Nocardia sp. NPDC057663 TaxID=3346201 RepID=UPI00366CEB56
MMTLAGCGEPSKTSATAASEPAAPTAVRTQPRGIESMNQPCLPQPGFYPAADAFVGPAPHPVAVFDSDNGPIWNTPLQPPEWMNQSDPLRYQLIVCLGVSQDGGELIRACEFTGIEPIRLPLFRGRYAARIYETRTAELLGTEQILGQPDRGCPTVVRFAPNERQWLFSNPDLIELQRVLGKYVY